MRWKKNYFYLERSADIPCITHTYAGSRLSRQFGLTNAYDIMGKLGEWLRCSLWFGMSIELLKR